MPVVVDNNFSLDTYGMRTERLIAIQGNFATVQTFLNAPAEIATWAEDCKDVYTEILSKSTVEKNQSESASIAVAEAEALMEEEYQNLRTLAVTIYVDHPKLFEQFSFKYAFPDKRDEKYNRVVDVLNTHQTFVDNSVTPLLPTTVINRLIAAKTDFEVALALQDKERGEAGLAQVALSERFVSDTKILNKLKSWWYAMMGKKDPRITWIGMVNPNTGGNSGQVPAVPGNLVFNYGSKVLWWDAVPTATSYQLQWFDGTDFVEIYSGSDDHFAYTPADGLNKFKVRARNNNGYSEFSPVLEQYYFEVLPKAANLQVVQSGTIPTEGELTWDAVPTAFNYKIYQSVDNLGEYAAHWLVIGTVTEPLKSVTLTLGKRNSFRVETNNTYQTSMSDEIYVEV